MGIMITILMPQNNNANAVAIVGNLPLIIEWTIIINSYSIINIQWYLWYLPIFIG